MKATKRLNQSLRPVVTNLAKNEVAEGLNMITKQEMQMVYLTLRELVILKNHVNQLSDTSGTTSEDLLTGTQGAGSSTGSSSFNNIYPLANFWNAGSFEYLLAARCSFSSPISSYNFPFKGPATTYAFPCLANKLCISSSPGYQDGPFFAIFLGHGRQTNRTLIMP